MLQATSTYSAPQGEKRLRAPLRCLWLTHRRQWRSTTQGLCTRHPRQMHHKLQSKETDTEAAFMNHPYLSHQRQTPQSPRGDGAGAGDTGDHGPEAQAPALRDDERGASEVMAQAGWPTRWEAARSAPVGASRWAAGGGAGDWGTAGRRGPGAPAGRA
mmetsp:Transcript_10966/g.32582  ORF Transcript_10966/g.32582 Transcript_10966/m.32582 type:complete len:158 (+) Transcript_10966:973-1446(+)